MCASAAAKPTALEIPMPRGQGMQGSGLGEVWRLGV